MRAGAEVQHEDFDDLGAAVASMRERALRIRADSPPPTKVLSRVTPAEQVQGRLELAGRGGFLRKTVAGIDVRADGTFVPYRGGLRREELDPSGHDTPFDLVRETLEGKKDEP